MPRRASAYQPGTRVEDDLAAHGGNGLVVALARIGLKRAFVIQIAPWMLGANLVGAARNADDVAAGGEAERVFGLQIDRLGQRVGILQPLRLAAVEALRVLD